MLKERLIDTLIKNQNELPYVNLDNENKYLGWTSNFNIELVDGVKMFLDLRNEKDLFLLFILASAWSKTDQWKILLFLLHT